MEMSSRTWESRHGNRDRSKRRHAKKTSFGVRERRRLMQLLTCLVLFFIVFLGKGIFPKNIVQIRDTCLAMIQEDTDFEAVFSELGRSVTTGEPVTDTLEGLWVEVFGGGTLESSKSHKAVQTATFQTQATFLSGYPEQVTLTEHWIETFGIVPETTSEAQETQVAEPVQTPQATPQPTVEHVVYDGPTLPENTSMDKYILETFGVSNTVTPALGWVSSPFGWREHPVDGGEKFHNGVDLAVNNGTDVLAFADGTIDYIGDSPVYGLYLQINHAGGLQTFYAHCSELLVQQGQSVKAGQVVALSGDTGNATGPHLHFEMKLNGIRINPLYYIETEA
ncbi:M23 family metallopeptidase [Flavonifractor hominis]|uniref:M23 family metallopeptidase n=1 Tax=Flavonifractor hominis TaxID=3133178 RepID=A0ABV1EKU1_9FIRM